MKYLIEALLVSTINIKYYFLFILGTSRHSCKCFFCYVLLCYKNPETISTKKYTSKN
jgi:hypothetical protein